MRLRGHSKRTIPAFNSCGSRPLREVGRRRYSVLDSDEINGENMARIWRENTSTNWAVGLSLLGTQKLLPLCCLESDCARAYYSAKCGVTVLPPSGRRH